MRCPLTIYTVREKEVIKMAVLRAENTREVL